MDRTNWMELVVAGLGCLPNEVLHGHCAVEENNCGIVKLKGVDRNRG